MSVSQSFHHLSPRGQSGELAAGRYGFAYLEDGPSHWRLQVTRREEE